MKDLHKKYCIEEFDAEGNLIKFDVNCPDNFNFSYDVIDEIGTKEPNRRALLWTNEKGEEFTFTYGELKDKSTQVANMFLAHGVQKGDKVICVLKRHYEFWFLIIGLIKIGVILVPATNQLMVKDYDYRFDAANIKYVVATAEGEVTQRIEESQKTYGNIKERFIVHGDRDGWINFNEEIAKYPTTMERFVTQADEDMLLYFTSGTTGYPKMVVHNYYYAAAHIITAKHWHNIKDYSLHLTISETGWAKSVWGKLFGQFFLGATVFVYDFDRFIPGDIMTLIEKYKITSFCAPPTMYRFFIKDGIENYDLSSLEYATIAGEALSPEVFNKFYEYTGLKLMEGFGQTEMVIMIANMPGTTPKPGSMGKPLPFFNCDIVDEEGKTVACGEVGEIVIRTNGKYQFGMFKGYYCNEEATVNAWHDDIYHTGDTAWRDEDGYYWYVGRTDDLIKASGYRIGPFEIESVLVEHPAVLECAVTGASDPIRGQVVKATIVLSKGFEPSEMLIKEIQEHVKNATAPYKYPRIVEFVSELPKTISGKIRRVEIRNKTEEQ